MAKPSDSTRSERRRNQNRALWTSRERQAYLLSEKINTIIQESCTDEIQDICEEISLFCDWIEKRAKQTHERDVELIKKAIGLHKCHYVSEIVDETKLTELIVRRALQKMMCEGIIQVTTVNKRKLIVLVETSDLKVA